MKTDRCLPADEWSPGARWAGTENRGPAGTRAKVVNKGKSCLSNSWISEALTSEALLAPERWPLSELASDSWRKESPSAPFICKPTNPQPRPLRPASSSPHTQGQYSPPSFPRARNQTGTYRPTLRSPPKSFPLAGPKPAHLAPPEETTLLPTKPGASPSAPRGTP